MDCGYSLEPPRRGGSKEYPQSMFWAEIRKKEKRALSKNFPFLVVKFSIYVNRRIFVMGICSPTNHLLSYKLDSSFRYFMCSLFPMSNLVLNGDLKSPCSLLQCSFFLFFFFVFSCGSLSLCLENRVPFKPVLEGVGVVDAAGETTLLPHDESQWYRDSDFRSLCALLPRVTFIDLTLTKY